MPKISCLMISRPSARRIAFAKRSIADYCGQTQDDRELVIVLDGSAESGDIAALSDHVQDMGRADIRLHLSPAGLRLGTLRNLGVALIGGDVICQWDDDDLYHPQRLERQLSLLEEGGHDAVYLQEIMHYFPDRQALYLANWRATPAGGHPGTLMARRGAMPDYPEMDRGEDLDLALALKARGSVGYLGGEPHLHLYVSHGGNTWNGDHHAMLARELSVSVALLRRREDTLRAGLAPYALLADSIDMTGNNGIAFRL